MGRLFRALTARPRRFRTMGPMSADIDYECGPGWAPLIDALLADLLALWPDITVQQVKEKFGRLTVYVTYPRDPALHAAVESRISIAAADASRMCELCGAPGRTRATGWIRVLCFDHAVANGHKVSEFEQDMVAKLGPSGTRVAARAAADAARSIESAIALVERLDTVSAGDPNSLWWSTGRPAAVGRLHASTVVLRCDTVGELDHTVAGLVARAAELAGSSPQPATAPPG